MEFGSRRSRRYTCVFQVVPLDDFTGFGFAIERNDAKSGCPSCEFPDPVCDCGLRDDDKNRICFPLRYYLAHKCCNLDGLALPELFSKEFKKPWSILYQTHFIGEDTRLVVIPIIAKPVEAINLQGIYQS